MDREEFERWRAGLSFRLVVHDNQTRCGYTIFKCGEVAHRGPAWVSGKKCRPTCGECARPAGTLIDGPAAREHMCCPRGPTLVVRRGFPIPIQTALAETCSIWQRFLLTADC